MADLKIIIKASESTSALENLASNNVACKVLVIPEDDISDANTELATINNENWTSSETATETNGHTTSDIKLPKSAFKK